MKHRIFALSLGLFASLVAFGADVPISGLPAGTTLAGTEEIPAVQSAATVKTTPAAVSTYVKSQGAALTRTSDTNVTLTLGGAPTTALLNATSITAGWTGQLSVARGGTGAATLTGIAKGNGTSAFTAAASSDVIGTWTGGGTCNSTTYLRGDGQCQAPPGSGATYSTGTFTATWETACTTNPTQTWKYVVVGTLVTLTATQDISCTSDSTTFTASAALPVGIRPDAGFNILGARLVDNGTADTNSGCLRVETDGSLTWFRSVASPCAGTAWTNSGTKSISFGSGSNNSPRSWTYDMDIVP